jgi:hypothetical protein
MSEEVEIDIAFIPVAINNNRQLIEINKLSAKTIIKTHASKEPKKPKLESKICENHSPKKPPPRGTFIRLKNRQRPKMRKTKPMNDKAEECCLL